MALDVWTDPGNPQGTDGWYWSIPSVYVEDEELGVGTLTGTASLGTYDNHTYYTSASTITVSGTSTEIYEESVLSGYANLPDVYAWITYSGADYSQCVKYTEEAPAWSSFSITDVRGTAVSTGYMPPIGYFKFEGLSAYTTAAVDMHITTIAIYCDSLKIIELQNSGTPYTDTFKGNYYNRGSYYSQTTVTGSYTLSSGAITIPFKLVDLPKNTNTVYAVVVNEAGHNSTTTKFRVTPESFPPAVDRISCEGGEGTSAAVSTVTIIGNCLGDGTLEGVEYTTDKKVPTLHCNFNGSALTQDFHAPVSSAGFSYSAGPFTSSTGATFSSTGYIEYENDALNAFQGTVEVWYKPDFGSGSTYDHSLFRFRRKDAVACDSLALTVNPAGIKLTVLDALSGVHTTSATFALSSGTWYHITAKWKIDKAGASSLYVKGREKGTSTSAYATTTGSTIPFALLPSRDLSSALEFTASTLSTMDFYDDLRIGNDWVPAASACVSGTIADFRLHDAWTYEDHSGCSGFSGWKTDDILVDINTKMFKYTDTGVVSGTANVVKLRPFTTWGTRQSSSFFNTPSCKPVLVRGYYQGVYLNGPEWVERFRFIDVQGDFADYQLEINPQAFSRSLGDDNFVQEVSSINGSRVLSTSQLPAETMTMTFNWCRRTQMQAIKERALSGNTFYVIDHNDEVYFGKMTMDSVEEIVATVPSRYNITVKLHGQGAFNDYTMG